jgi:ABC-2 type transport system ATP-binding protein
MIAPADDPMQPVIQIRSLRRSFGRKVALGDVSLSVPRGSVFGLVGENGAGKTTLIKHVLGLLKAQAGSVRVFGLDPVADPVGVLSRLGYLSEENQLPGWMRVGNLLRYVRAFHPGWDPDYAETLRRDFELDPSARIRNLSKGQRARAGLIVALAHRPELLLLDEPSSGLDPVVRRDILSAIIRTIADEGRTVLFSSHLLQEVERVSDHVAMMRAGRIVFADEIEQIQHSHCRIVLRFDQPLLHPPAIHGAMGWEGQGSEWSALWHDDQGAMEVAAAELGARIINQRPVSLDEIFLARVAGANMPAQE